MHATETSPAEDAAEVAIAAVDDMLRIVGMVRAEKPRDPLRRLEDVMLDLRGKVREA
jgi:hypothetical protein